MSSFTIHISHYLDLIQAFGSVKLLKFDSLFYSQLCYNSPYNYGILSLEALFVNKDPAFTFWIIKHFQVDPYPKVPDPPISMWRTRNPDLVFILYYINIICLVNFCKFILVWAPDISWNLPISWRMYRTQSIHSKGDN